jgi:hypothetical protein
VVIIYLRDGKVERVAADCATRIDPVFVFNVSDADAEPELKMTDTMTAAERKFCIEGRLK